MFKGDVTYQLPFGKGRPFLNRGGVLDAVLGGWQASTMFVLETGRPYTAVVGRPITADLLSGNNCNGIPTWLAIHRLPIRAWTSGSIRPRLQFPRQGPSATPAATRSVDLEFRMSTFRSARTSGFPLPRETGNLQIRFDAMNVLNHPNFDIPNAGIGKLNAGTITAITGNYSTTDNAFGPRKLQLGARFSF